MKAKHEHHKKHDHAVSKSEPPRFPRYRTVPEGEEWSSEKVFETVHDYIISQIHFTKNWQPVVVTLWALGTYLHRQFPCYGHLWLNSPTTHSGKTKLMNLLSALCYKASEPQLEPTAAVLFRFPSSIGGTLLIDEVDKLDPQKRSDVIAMLNHYTKRGAVMRNVPGKNRKYTIETFPVYCPKVIAGIENLPGTLQDRCIKIVLHRKKQDEKVLRFMPGDYEQLKPIRNQIEAWAVRDAFVVMKAHLNHRRLGVPTDVDDDRVRDILEPLFAIASVLPKWVRKRLAEGASEINRGRKSEEEELNPVVASLKILMKQFPKNEDVWKLRSQEVVNLLGEIPGLETKSAVQSVLRKLDFHSGTQRIPDIPKPTRGYKFPRRTLKKLFRRYVK